MEPKQQTTPQSVFFAASVKGVGPFESVRRHPLIAVLPLVVLVTLAVAYSLTREPTYTAETRQAVGRIDVSDPGALAGFASATTALASNYSRAIEAAPVVRRVAQSSGLGELEVRSRLTATPIPDSPVYRVIAEGTSTRQALLLANTAAAALSDYITSINSRNPNADRQFQRFERASLEEQRRRADLMELQIEIVGDPTPQQREELSEIKADIETAKLDVEVARLNYTQSKQSQSNAELIQTVSRARNASSDQGERLQIALFIAVATGVLLGIAAAMARSSRDLRRAALAA